MVVFLVHSFVPGHINDRRAVQLPEFGFARMALPPNVIGPVGSSISALCGLSADGPGPEGGVCEPVTNGYEAEWRR